jgi:hypothetical protein
MEASKKRNIKSGAEYDNLFSHSENDNKTIRKNANVYHTVDFIPKVVQQTLDQTKRISQALKGKTIYETCSNIWHFVYRHINYKKDAEGYEQIRSPARAWHDRKQGVDCDCYSVFISSILTNLGIPHILRITKYHRDYFQHIYPIVPHGKKHITIDCVTDRFDYEVPYSEKKDYPMDLQYLNGFDGGGMEELGKILKKNLAKNKTASPAKVKLPKAVKKANKKTAKSNTATPASASSSMPAPKKKGLFKKVLNVVNKVNPATVLLRNGVLAAMKLNVKNVAARLRWSYLTPQQAAAKNIDPVKFQKLIATRQKLEKIFHGAGGKIDNLKKAILGGKGNKDKAVSGLGMLPMADWVGYMNEYTALDQLLGNEIYYSENVDGMEGFGGFGQLGEPVTLATVGAAMGVIAGIVAALKQIGDIFKSKTKGSDDFNEEKTDAPENNVPANASDTASPSVITNTILPEQNSLMTAKENPLSPNEGYADEASLPVKTLVSQSTDNNNMVILPEEAGDKPTASTTDTTSPGNTGDEKEGFWEKNKKWLKPVVIGAGSLAIIAIGFKIFKTDKTHNKSSPALSGLSGAPFRKKKKKNYHRKSKHHHKKAVALL